MPLPITARTIIATYHHARQTDLDPTAQELRAWNQILQANYKQVLPAAMVQQGLPTGNPDLVDLALLLSELTEFPGVVAQATRGCGVVAGLLRSGAIADGSTPVGMAGAAMFSAGASATPKKTINAKKAKQSKKPKTTG